MKIIMPSPKKVIAVTYEWCLFMRCSNYKASTGKNLVFWIGGRLWEVVTHRGSTVLLLLLLLVVEETFLSLIAILQLFVFP